MFKLFKRLTAKEVGMIVISILFNSLFGIRGSNLYFKNYGTPTDERDSSF